MEAIDGHASPAEEIPTRVSSRGWLAFASGLNLAFAASYLMCKAPGPHTLSWAARLATCILYLFVACCAGALGTWIALPRESRGQFATLSRGGFRGWIFLPAIVLFLQLGSIWAQLMAVASAALMAMYLWRSGAVPAQKNAPIPPGLFAAEISLAPVSFFACVLSLLAYGAFLSTMDGRIVLATALLAAATFLAVLRFATDRKASENARRSKPGLFRNVRPFVLTAIALYCILISLSNPRNLPFAHLGLHGSAPDRQANQPPDPHPAAAGYRTIILWPTEKPEKVIPPPPVKGNASSAGIAKPRVIPFFGPYWYFKFPGELPGPNTRTSRGDPLKANVRSTDAYPLLMEAHQHLAEPIDLACCSALQIVFRNDASAGAIAVGITLSDSHQPVKLSQNLGVKAVGYQPAAGSSSSEQTLVFLLPRHAMIQQFDDIDVTFLPDPRHTTAGRRVAVERFVLIPN